MPFQKETDALLEAAREGQAKVIQSEAFDQQLWRLRASTVQEKKHELGVYLMPNKGMPEAITPKVTVTAYVQDTGGPKLNERCYDSHEFPEGTTGGFGWSVFLDEISLRRLGGNKLVVNVKIELGDAPSEAFTPFPQLLNDPLCSDVVVYSANAPASLVFVQKATIQRCQHFATSLKSGFKETSARLSHPATRQAPPKDIYAGDESEFSSFDSTHAFVSASAQRATQDSDQVLSTSPGSSSSTCDDQHSLGVSNPAPKEVDSLRSYISLEINDCSYASLRAFLYYLYTYKIEFAPSQAGFYTRSNGGDKSGSSSSLTPTQWAATKAPFPPRFASSPHAIYRLADFYELPDLKRLAKNAILEGITIETAPYELFSQLSRDFEDVQTDLVEFVLHNIKLVTATPGWDRAIKLMDEGALPGGGEILNKLLLRRQS